MISKYYSRRETFAYKKKFDQKIFDENFWWETVFKEMILQQ
jgi:hypothetical protein